MPEKRAELYPRGGPVKGALDWTPASFRVKVIGIMPQGVDKPDPKTKTSVDGKIGVDGKSAGDSISGVLLGEVEFSA